MVACALHRLSRRKDRLLLACDCTALAPTLLESELFGHVKGLVLRGHRRQAGALRGGPRRHPLPRRSRQPQHGDAGEAAARAGDQAGPQGRRHGRTRGEHPPHRRHQPRPDRAGQGRRVPRGPLLPAERRAHRLAAFARAAGRHPLAGHVVSRTLLQERWRSRSRASRPRPCARWRVITGRATSASCATSSSGWRFFAKATASTSRICPPRSARPRCARPSPNCR